MRRLALPLLLLLASPAFAETLRVGPGERFREPREAAAAAAPGDRVLIAPGRYGCAIWRAPRLAISALPGGAVEVAGPVCADKGLFVIAAPDITVTGITFTGARSSAGNGAGIRVEGGSLAVRNSRFLDNQNGILTAALPGAELLIEDSAFIGNGALESECAHGLYAGRIASLVIRRTRFEATRSCHHVKSRAARTEITDSIIEDGAGDASYLVELPNGGELLLANSRLVKGPRSGNPRAAVAIGAEGIAWPNLRYRLAGNLFVNRMPRGTVFLLNLTPMPAELRGNRFEGAVLPIQGPGSVE